jgi:hypothetical protein
MSGVLVLVVVGLWGLLGRWVWRNFVAPRVPAARSRVAGIAFALAWYVVPVGDEILGAVTFRRLCEAIPPTRFHGPIPVGPGAFFDEQGNRKWNSEEDWLRLGVGTAEWERLWDRRASDRQLCSWPVRIFETQSLRVDSATGRVVVESYFRGSAGGWLRRTIGIGLLGSYQCFSKGTYPSDQDTIAFDYGLLPRTGGPTP